MTADRPRADSLDAPVDIENGLLVKWRRNSKIQKRLHNATRRLYKIMSDTTTISGVVLSLSVGFINIVYGVGITTESASTPSIAAGCISLVSSSIVALSMAMQWNTKSVLHDEYASRYSEMVREINTESMLSRLEDGKFRNQAEFIKHVSGMFDLLEIHAPPIPRLIELTVHQKSSLGNGD